MTIPADELDRVSPGTAEDVISRLVVIPAQRRQVLTLVAHAIEHANAASSDRWGLTLSPAMLRLNVGLIEVITITHELVHLVLDRDSLPSKLRPIGGLEITLEAGAAYSSVPESVICEFPTARAGAVLAMVRNALDALISKAARTPRNAKTAAAHSPGVLRFLRRELNRELPDPSYSTVAMAKLRSLKLTRISYNASGWRYPTGDARKNEQPGTYNHENGFGHEDWLFRDEWQIDGWRYAFLQGVNKSHARLVKESRPFDVTLFTIHPDKRREYVATIRDVECLDESQAEDARARYEQLGWMGEMLREIRQVGGNVEALGDAEWARHVFNVRFRVRNVDRFKKQTFASADDPIQSLSRYLLADAQAIGQSKTGIRARPAGSEDLPEAKAVQRRAVAATSYSPEHQRMQAVLMTELRAEYPRAAVVRERDFVDVSVVTDSEVLLYEIKSDLDPRSVIREALGQILEYAYHPARSHPLPVRLVIVGRNALSAEDEHYLARLQGEFALPLSYRVIRI